MEIDHGRTNPHGPRGLQGHGGEVCFVGSCGRMGMLKKGSGSCGHLAIVTA